MFFFILEIYIDQFFAEQLLTQWCLLHLACRAGRLRMRRGHYLAAELLGAVMQCIYVLSGWKWIALAACPAMAFLAFARGERRSGLFFLSIVSLLFGGTVEAVITMLPLGASAGIIAAYMMIQAGLTQITRCRRKAEEEMEVQLLQGGVELTVRALVDTGNRLREPVTGRPVSILDAAVAKKLLGSGWEKEKGFLLIPYHSIGKEHGWMKGVTIDRMKLITAGGYLEVTRPILAISDGRISAGDVYQVILNVEHLQQARNAELWS